MSGRSQGVPPASLGGATAPVEDRLDRSRRWVSSLSGWRKRAVAVAAGAVSLLAMAPFHVAPVLFLTLPVLVWLIDGIDASRGRWRASLAAAEIGWWFGFGYHFPGLLWIGEAFLVEAELFAWAMPFAVSLLPAGLALFMALGMAGYRAAELTGFARVAGLAAAIGLAEWLRGHVLTGLPWNVLGYALTYPLVLMQGAGLAGIYGLTLIAVAVFAAPAVLAADAARTPSFAAALRRGLALSFGLLLALLAYGTFVLATSARGEFPGVKLRIVQPSVPQREKWMRDKQRPIFDLHLDLSRTSPKGDKDGMAGITHVVWPEAAMPFLPLDSPEALAEVGALVGSHARLVTGALRVERPQGSADIPDTSHRVRVFNSLMAFGAGGRLDALYDKVHLVPFGEYLPWPWLFDAIGLQELTRLRGGFAVGLAPRPLLAIPGLPPVAPLICYEAIFPAAVVQGKDRPGLIVNVTNDGWFGNTTGPRQHLHQARVRAVEEGVPLIRSANNGISALIDANGRVLQRLDLDVRGTIDAPLPQMLSPPPYSRWGDALFWIAFAGVLVFCTASQSMVRVRHS